MPKVKQAAEKKYIREADYETIKYFNEKKKYPVIELCAILKINRSSYYKWLNKKPLDKEDEDKKILEIIQKRAEENNRVFGYRKMKYVVEKELRKTVNKKRIYRLMSLNDLGSVYRKKKKRYPRVKPEQTASNKLSRDFNASRSNEKWCTDITEIKYKGISSKLYISSIMDLYDRSIVGLCVSTRNDTILVNNTFQMAIAANPDAHPLFHSDRGFQYTRRVFQKQLNDQGIEQSMSRVGHCIDNGPMESFQGIIKDILFIRHPDLKTLEELEEAVYETFDYYMNEYPQERFNGKTAAEVRKEAMESNKCIQYPIKTNPAIERFWSEIETKKEASQING